MRWAAAILAAVFLLLADGRGTTIFPSPGTPGEGREGAPSANARPTSGPLPTLPRNTGGGNERFSWVDVYIDPHGKPLAAWQLELKASGAGVTLVGIEGGEHPAYAQPPYYDPKANAQDRIIIGAFNTGDDLPRRRTRVARVMLRVTGVGVVRYSAKLDVAASSDAKPIENAKVDVSEGAEQ